MIRTVKGGPRRGTVSIPASKSQAHRQLICAALARESTVFSCDGISKDIRATINCLNALGAQISQRDDSLFDIKPVTAAPGGTCTLPCGESGSTLRFLTPIAGALGINAVFRMEGKLPSRPMDEYTSLLSARGMVFRRENDLLYCSGMLTPGEYSIPGDISSQYISGLLFALPLLEGESTLSVTGSIESADYITMTENALVKSGITFSKEKNTYTIPGRQSYHSQGLVKVEQDWSNAAFFLCMGALSPYGVTISEMPLYSAQGDKAILDILHSFGAEIITEGSAVTVRGGSLAGQTVDAKAIPDLVPAVCAAAAGAKGTTCIVNAGRLRLKESDRLKTTAAMLRSLGADICEEGDGLVIHGKPRLSGGMCDSANDHRIAMAAAVAAGICKSGTVILGSECVEKSFPSFWDRLETLEVCQ